MANFTTTLTLRANDLLSGKLKSINQAISGFVDKVNAKAKQASMFDLMIAKADVLSHRMKRLGSSMTTSMSMPLAALGVGVGRAALSYEQAMKDFAKVSKKSLAEVQGSVFDQRAQQLGKTTQFGASEAMQAMVYLKQAGLNEAQILGAVQPTLQAASAGNMNLARAADVTTNALLAFGLEAANAEQTTASLTRINDNAATAANNSNTSFAEMMEAYKQAAPVARALGMSVEQTTAM